MAVVWLIGAFFTKRTQKSSTQGSRTFELCLLVAGFSLLFNERVRIGVLDARVIPASAAFEWGGVLVTLTGIAFAIWARVYLGSNWSAIASVKEGHSLVRSGPYSVVRHPIYTGLTAAVLGTALVYGKAGCFLALPMTVVAWRKKSLIEEGFMREQFGGEYVRYMREVKALIPFVW